MDETYFQTYRHGIMKVGFYFLKGQKNMGKKPKIRYTLNNVDNISPLPEYEINTILRAADDIIFSGGRTMLAKILKGSKDKK